MYFEVWYYSDYNLFFFKPCCSYWLWLWSFVVWYDFRVGCFILVENFIGVFVRIALNLSVTLGSLDIFTLLILICEPEVSFCFWCLFQFFPPCFIFFHCIIYSYSCLNLFLAISVALAKWDALKYRSPVMYGNAPGFCILLSCPAALLSLINVIDHLLNTKQCYKKDMSLREDTEN